MLQPCAGLRLDPSLHYQYLPCLHDLFPTIVFARCALAVFCQLLVLTLFRRTCGTRHLESYFPACEAVRLAVTSL